MNYQREVREHFRRGSKDFSLRLIVTGEKEIDVKLVVDDINLVEAGDVIDKKEVDTAQEPLTTLKVALEVYQVDIGK